MSLKEKRIKNNITQEELARKAEVSVSTITKAERKNTCSLDTAKKISEILGESIEDIFFK